MKHFLLLLFCVAALAADTSDLKVKLRETERDYYFTLLNISQLQAKALQLQNQIAQQYADLAKGCEERATLDHQSLTCGNK